MARTRKCDECRKDCVKSTMFVVEDFDRNYNVKINYYCNEECSKAKEKRKKLIKEINDLFNLEQDLNIHVFNLDDFDGVELTYQQLSSIMFMIEE